MGHLLDRIYGRLRDAVSSGDELIEKQLDAAPEATDKKTDCAEPPELIEEIDFYWEGNCMVLTAKYLLKRGYCCESGCRHCPYGFNRNS